MMIQKYWHTEGKEWAYEKCYEDLKKSIKKSIHFHNFYVFTNKNSKGLTVEVKNKQQQQQQKPKNPSKKPKPKTKSECNSIMCAFGLEKLKEWGQ